MLRFFQERRNAALLGGLFFVSFILMTFSVRQQGSTTLMERGLLSAVGLVAETAAVPKHWLRSFWNQYLYLVGVQAENERLNKKLGSLQNLTVRALELEKQTGRLERLLSAAKKTSAPVKLAQVVAREFGPKTHTMIINMGHADGVRRNMPVLNEDGVVGRIFRVGRGVSQVLLLTDFRSAVDVIVQRSRASGVFSITPRGSAELKYLTAQGDVRKGDLLISSGLGGVYPKGLAVAQVLSVSPGGENLFRKITAKPLVNFQQIEEVLVLMMAVKKDPWK